MALCGFWQLSSGLLSKIEAAFEHVGHMRIAHIVGMALVATLCIAIVAAPRPLWRDPLKTALQGPGWVCVPLELAAHGNEEINHARDGGFCCSNLGKQPRVDRVNHRLVHAVCSLLHEWWRDEQVYQRWHVLPRAKRLDELNHVMVVRCISAVAQIAAAVMLPIVRTTRANVFSIVCPQHDCHNIPRVLDQSVKLWSLPKRRVTAFEHGGAAGSQVGDGVCTFSVCRVQKDLKLLRVRMIPSARTHTCCDRVANIGHSDGLRAEGLPGRADEVFGRRAHVEVEESMLTNTIRKTWYSQSGIDRQCGDMRRRG
mmetsp:Transcript_38428/g.101322  ORF Transcript_38428/g.101322 Transcript_38428/m.101322 type:complete len:312 (-) Transcript_38428:54-989(-)